MSDPLQTNENNLAGIWGGKLRSVKSQFNSLQQKITAYVEIDEDLTLSRHLLLVAIAAFFVLFFIWANVARLDEVTRGEGRIVPSSEVQAIGVLEPGIIEEILVQEGSQVAAGQILLRLSDIQASSDYGASQSRSLALAAAIARLEVEASAQMDQISDIDFPAEIEEQAPKAVAEERNNFLANRRQFEDQRGILQQQLSQKNQEVAGLEKQVEDTQAVLKLQEEEKAVIEPLVKRGSAAKIELLQLERGLKEKSAQLNTVVSALTQAQAAVKESQSRLDELGTSARAKAQSELSAKKAELDEISQRLMALADRKTRTELRAPVSGTIQNIAVKTIGGIARPGQDIITLVPKDDELIVEAKIKPSDRAFLFPGQKAVVKITAYDYSVYGGLKAEVLDISADSIEDERKNIYYRVRLRTFDRALKHRGKDYPIIPGMVASAEILTGQKSVMEYLLKPLIKTIDRAFSER